MALSMAATFERPLGSVDLLLSSPMRSQASLRAFSLRSAGGRKQSVDSPWTLNATSFIVHVSSILVLVWLLAVSPNLNRVRTDLPAWAMLTPSTSLYSSILDSILVSQKTASSPMA
eukprot:Gb_31529 [translate_table: standard]